MTARKHPHCRNQADVGQLGGQVMYAAEAHHVDPDRVLVSLAVFGLRNDARDQREAERKRPANELPPPALFS